MTALIIALFIAAALLSVPIAHALVLASVGGLLIIDKVPVHLAIDLKEPARLYAVAVEPGSHATALLASADGGETWSEFVK